VVRHGYTWQQLPCGRFPKLATQDPNCLLATTQSCGHPRTTITAYCLPAACSSDEDILRAAWVARGRTACAAERTARETPNSARIRIARATWAQQNQPHQGAQHPYSSSPLRANSAWRLKRTEGGSRSLHCVVGAKKNGSSKDFSPAAGKNLILQVIVQLALVLLLNALVACLLCIRVPVR